MRKKNKDKDTDYSTPTLHNYDGDLSKRWFINFYIKDQKTGQFVRKRITSINSEKTYSGRMTEARRVLKELQDLLKEGYKIQRPEENDDTSEIDIKKLSFIEAINFAIKKKKQIVSKKRVSDYNSFRNTVTTFLESRKIANIPFHKVTTQIIYDFFDWLIVVRKVEKKTYNNYKTDMTAIYNVYVRRKLIKENLCSSVARLKVRKGGGHKAFTAEQLKSLKDEIISSGDHQLFLFVSFIYYCFIRPHQELRFLQVKHLHEKTVYVPPELSKNEIGEHVIIPPGLEKLIQQYGIRNFPPDYYIFSRKQRPDVKPVGKEYFYDRHVTILKAVGLHGKDYDIYGYKHTGNIHLFKAGADIKEIQKHNRHSSIEMTDKYLKDLGLITNDEVFNKFPEF